MAADGHAADDENDGISGWGRAEGSAGNGPPPRHREGLRPSRSSRCLRTRPPGGGVPRYNDMRRHQPAPGRHHASQEPRGHGEGGIGDHPEGPPREAEVTGIGLDDGDGESLVLVAEPPGPGGVELHGDDPRSRSQERRGQGTRPGADVEHEIAALDTGVRDDQAGPAPIEGVPSPQWPRVPGHGASWC